MSLDNFWRIFRACYLRTSDLRDLALYSNASNWKEREISDFLHLARKYFIFPLINIHFVAVLLSKEIPRVKSGWHHVS